MAAAKQKTTKKTDNLPTVAFPSAHHEPDYATILGILFAVGLILAAIMIGESNANFLNAPALMIVFFGTMAATAISFTPDELNKVVHVIGNSIVRKVHAPGAMAKTMLDLSVLARKNGILTLSKYESDFKKDPYTKRAMQMVIDGTNADQVDLFLGHEIDIMAERHKRAATITRRAAEVAPAMGLIGTLVGLVQMLAQLESPETIGPAMAVALLTTFYGAILGTIIMAPLAIKLEKNSADEVMIKKLIAMAAVSIARQDNPRNLEMLFNSELPPGQRINYFD